MNKPEDAIPQFELALQIDPDNISALSHLAYQLSQKGDSKQALPLLEKALSLGRDDAWLYAQLGYDY